VSGGEERRALRPSLNAGRRVRRVEELKTDLEAVAAKVDAKTGKPIPGAQPGKPVTGGVPCTTYIGENGAAIT